MKPILNADSMLGTSGLDANFQPDFDANFIPGLDANLKPGLDANSKSCLGA